MPRSLVLSLIFALTAGAPALADPPAAPASPSPAPAEAASPAAAPESPAPAASSAPASSPTDPAITVRAMDWLRRLQSGDIDRTQLTTGLNSQMSPERVQMTESAFKALGKIVASKYLREDAQHGIRGYQYEIDFALAKYIYLFEVDEKDQIAGLFLSPLR